jgi:HD-GYP domain-containing protein (c-di-GMP phosphodiesterase class II)
MIALSETWRLALKIKELEEQQKAARNTVICAFNQLLDLKDLGTGKHSTRLAEWAVRIGRLIGMSEPDLYQLEVAAMVHDVGKIGVPDAILHKPGKLTLEERAIIQKHPEYGWSILRLFDSLEQASLYVLHHHESLDGSGYPAGLKGEDIPLGARIVSVVDSFDAMISSRSYRSGLPHDEAVRRLLAASGTQFDPAIIDVFVPIAEKEVLNVFAATGTDARIAL